MEKEIIEASKVFSPILVAIIGAVAGLISGTIASLIAPWVQYAIETRRKSIEYRSNLIKETRRLLDNAKEIREIRSSSLWGFIDKNLNDAERKIVFPGALIIEVSKSGVSDQMSQNDHRKQGISIMLSRLEHEWQLTNT